MMHATYEELDRLANEIALDERAQMMIEEASDEGAGSAPALIAQGCFAVYAKLFGEDSVEALAHHHREAIEWHFMSRLAFLRGERPAYLAYFPIWSRGHMKSTVAERMVVVDAFLSAAHKQPGFCLYVSRNKSKVQEHISNIETLLSGGAVRRYFPGLSQVKRNEETNQMRRWTGTFLHTEDNYAVKGGSLDSGLAGSRIEQTRITLIVPDDIDGREDSPVISESRFRQLTTEILPMGQANTLVFYAQNLISRYSVMYRIQKGHARVLTNRKPTQPIPAVRDLVTRLETVGGIVKDVFVSGTPTWGVWDEQRIQDEIDREGLNSFLRECQHEVDQDKEGLALQHYDDSVHVISRSEFARMFGTRDIPSRWYKYVFNDWARTKTKHHANVAGILTVSGQESRLPGSVFLFSPMSFKAATAPEDVAKKILNAISPTIRSSTVTYTWDDLIKSTLQKTNLEHLVTDTTQLIEYRRTLLAKVIPHYVSPILAAQNYSIWRMSHERTDVKKVYRDVFGLPFSGVNPGSDGGLDTLNLLMRVDYNVPHAFRPDQKGFTNFYIVVDDAPDGSVPAYNEALSPDDLHDADLLRYQFKNWRFRDPHLTVMGETEGELLKMNDDFGNGLMMLFHDNCVFAAPLTKEERAMESLPGAVKPAAIAQITDPQERANKLMAQQMLMRREMERVDRPRTRNVMARLRQGLLKR